MAKDAKRQIGEGLAVLGIEFGSTRIKAVLVGEDNEPLASGAHDWENRLEGGIWTYTLEDIRIGMQDCYAKLKEDVAQRYGVVPTRLRALGISGMMHGYLAFDKGGELLSPFRTWRNNIAEKAADKLTEILGYHIPARWSSAHLYQAVLAGEEHVKRIDFLATLAVYVHFLLTGEKVVGVGEASGMFPVDTKTRDFDAALLQKFDAAVGQYGLPYKLREILPRVLAAGDAAGNLTAAGARLLDPAGDLQPGVPCCPPEGDAGTGMVATNSVRRCSGNVSAGTSVFAMIVLEKELSKVYPEIDLVTTPAGDLVAMVHCNNCTSDLNAWVNLFGDFAVRAGLNISKPKLYDLLYTASLEGDKDCGGLLAYNCVSGENITHIDAGRPLFVRTPENKFDLANFMRANLYSAFGALKVGCDILLKTEKVKVDSVTGHGGIFKTEKVAQSYLAAAIGAPVTVMKTAGEGGAWGIAVLANYRIRKEAGETLESYLDKKVFAGQEGITLVPDAKDVDGFEKFAARYVKALPVVHSAVKFVE